MVRVIKFDDRKGAGLKPVPETCSRGHVTRIRADLGRMTGPVTLSGPLDFEVRPGGMAEWLKATVLKTVVGGNVYRGFESHSLRQFTIELGR